MTFGVFIHRSDSIYSDIPAESYQFPPQYLGRVQACIGDWIVYLEPSKVPQTRGYFAVAKIQQVIPDPGTAGMYRAIVEAGTYLEFADPVPFTGPAGPIESGLLNDEGRISGRAQSAVRPLSPADFRRIVEAGLDEHEALLPRIGDAASNGFEDEQAPFVYEQERVRVERLVSRVMRDRVFRSLVLNAYDQRCAITGLKLINGGGRAEVEAAHIRPVEANGPDSLRNGIALSGTAHWMFDRGMISLADDLTILVSRQVNDQEGVRAMVNRSGLAIVPERAAQRPHPQFLKWHRDNCFKQ
jgi:putative restriction endonuclease